MLFEILPEIIFIMLFLSSALYFKGLFKFGRAYNVFTLYLFAMAIIEWSLRITRLYDLTDNNLFLFVYYFVSQFILLSLFYKAILKYKWIDYILIGALVFFLFQYLNDPMLYFRYNPIGVVVGQGIIVVYSLLYFYKLLTDSGEFMIVNVGVFFFLLCSMMIFASGNLVLNQEISPDVIYTMGKIKRLLYFTFLVLILVEWYRNYRIIPKSS